MDKNNNKTQLRGQIALPRTTAVKGGWRLAAAGSMSGMLTNTLLHPLDTIKTVRQTDPKSFKGIAPTLFAIIEKRGLGALYSGLLPALIGSSVSTALYFGMYEYAKARISKAYPKAWSSTRSRIPLTSFSAACGNVASSIVYVPKEVVKQRLQFGKHGKQVTSVMANLFRTSGVLGFFQGYKATLFRNIPSAMIRFAAYEEFKMVIHNFKKNGNNNTNTNGALNMSPQDLVLAGSLAGALSSACTTPMDVVKTGFATGVIKPGTALPGAIRDIVRNQGVGGLFIGIRPRVIWSAAFAAIGFTSYEIFKAWITGEPSPFQNGMSRTDRKVIVNQDHVEQKKTI